MEKRLYRSKTDRLIAGVCGGLGEYFQIDPVIFRVVFLVALFANGAGGVLYIILALVIPEAPATESKKEDNKATNKETTMDESETKRHSGGHFRGGLILIAIGVLFLLNNLVPLYHWADWWPIILIVMGVVIMLPRRSNY